MTLRTLTHAELQISPLNVRKNKATAEAVDAMAENIAAEGMLFPLLVHPMALAADLFPDWGAQGGNAGAPYGALAGGRRWRAIGKLIAAGRLPVDHPIECVVREADPARITSVSLAENLLRQDLDPWEVHSAIADAVARGQSPEQVARTLGQSEKWVNQQLRLGTLIPEIFAAYADGQLAGDQARAFAATEDRELQLLAWQHFQRSREYERHPSNIRAFLKIGDREFEQLMRFVGAPAYSAAGGRFELDLFSDGPDERGRVLDETLLRQLADDRLEEHRARLRNNTGRKDLRFAKDPPQNAGTTDWALKIEPEYRGKHKIVLPVGDVVATLAIGAGGEVDVGFWWESRKAKSASARAATEARAKGEAPPADAADPVEIRSRIDNGATIADAAAFDQHSFYAQAGRQVVKEKFGLTADGLQAARSMRRTLLRQVLLADACDEGVLARDYLIWSLLRQEFGGDRWSRTGARALASAWGGGDDTEPKDVVGFVLEEMPACAEWQANLRELAEEPFMQAKDPAESLALYVDLEERVKSWAAALLAGAALVRSANVPGWRVRAHDKLVELAGQDDATIRASGYWKPTPAFLGLFPKLKRLELAQPHVEAEAFRTWHKRDDKTITGACAGALELAGDWVHPLLAFETGRLAADPDDRDPDAEQNPSVNDTAAAELEAAE